MQIYNLIEYSPGYSETTETTESLWFYSKQEVTHFNTDIANDDNFKSSIRKYSYSTYSKK